MPICVVSLILPRVKHGAGLAHLHFLIGFWVGGGTVEMDEGEGRGRSRENEAHVEEGWGEGIFESSW